MNAYNSKKAFRQLCKRGTSFLGCDRAIMGGAMSWVSEAGLVSAISNAGGFGIIACGSMSKDLLDREIKKTFSLTNKPFGVNIITMHPDIEDLILVCSSNNVRYVILAGGVPKKEHIEKIKGFGAKAICFAPSAKIGRRLIKLGVDALIIEGFEAGGHVGPVSSSVLAQEILPDIGMEVPIFTAGGIGRGEMMLSYMLMGASGIQIGTLLACSKESSAHPEFKKSFIKANSRDAILSEQVDPDFPIIPVRALRNDASNKFPIYQRTIIEEYRTNLHSKLDAQLMIEKYWAGALRKGVIDGDIENGSLMAGQCVGLIKEELSVVEIFDLLEIQAEHAIERMNALIESRDTTV